MKGLPASKGEGNIEKKNEKTTWNLTVINNELREWWWQWHFFLFFFFEKINGGDIDQIDFNIPTPQENAYQCLR